MRPACCLLLALALLPSAASAQTERRPGSGWREVFDRERRLAFHYRQEGLRLLSLSLGPERELDPALGDAPRWLQLERALLRFERARRANPEDVELAYYTAWTLSRYRRPAPDGSTELREDEARGAWERVRAIDPAFSADRVAFELATLHMRRHEFPEALAEYEAALMHVVPPTLDLMDRFFLAAPMERRLAALFASIDASQVHGNLAEAAMLAGDLRRAVAGYRAAFEQTDDAISRSLAQWGLALALHRSDAHDEALRIAARALREDPVSAIPELQAVSRAHGAFAVLHIDNVFFEPPSELHAYEALGHEALARAREGGADLEELRRATRSWRLFFGEGGNASRYAPNARRALERLEAELAPRPTPRRPRRPL